MKRADSLQLVNAILALRPDWDAMELGGLRYLEGGYGNDNFRFRYEANEYVLRMPGPPTLFTDHAFEALFYRAAEGVATAEVVAYEAASGRMITRWVSGRLLADLRLDLDAAVAYLRDLHGQLANARTRAGGLLERRYNPLTHARALLDQGDGPRWIERIAEDLDWPLNPSMLCHNDLNPWNLIQTPDERWVTLDWEWAGVNDPLFDLVVLHNGAGFDAADLLRLAQAYLGRHPEPGRLEVCSTAFWLREYGWAAARIAAGDRRQEIVEQKELGHAKLLALKSLTY